ASNVRSIVYLGSAMLLLAVGAAFTWAIPNPKYDKSPHTAWIGVPVMVVGLFLLAKAAYLFYTATHRHVRAMVHPFLARALAPLAPTVDELSSIVSEQRVAKHFIGRYLSPRLLDQAIRSWRPQGTPS